MANQPLGNFSDIFNMESLKLSGGETGHGLNAGGGDDQITGSSLADFIFGESGRDKLYGMGGSDHLDGGSQNDTLYAGNGESSFTATGDDFLLGGTGNDILVSRDGGEDELTGNAGDDIYVVNFNGITKINDDWTATQTTNVAGYTGGNDTVWIDTHTLLKNVTFGRAGDNLFIYDSTASDAATNHVELNEFFNRSTADDIDVINLVGINGLSKAYSHEAIEAAFQG